MQTGFVIETPVIEMSLLLASKSQVFVSSTESAFLQQYRLQQLRVPDFFGTTFCNSFGPQTQAATASQEASSQADNEEVSLVIPNGITTTI